MKLPRLLVISSPRRRLSEIFHSREEILTVLDSRRRLDSILFRSSSNSSADELIWSDDTHTQSRAGITRTGQEMMQGRVQGMWCGPSSSHERELWPDKKYDLTPPWSSGANQDMRSCDSLSPSQRALGQLRKHTHRAKQSMCVDELTPCQGRSWQKAMSWRFILHVTDSLDSM